MRNTKLKREILESSEGLLEKATDLVLFILFFGLGLSTRGRRSSEVYKAEREAVEILKKVNYQTVKRAFSHLRKKGFIKYVKEEAILKPQITKRGFQRLKEIIPVYDEERIWDRRIYLVAYDIPEERKNDREMLREFLKRLGAGMFQESVWLILYNPREILRKYVFEHNLEGWVIVSDVGEDGSVGEEDLSELVARVYKLDELNDRYRKFLDRYLDSEKRHRRREAVIFDYLSILRDDPQIPFRLLPKDWVGEDAYKLYQKILRSLKSGRETDKLK